MADNIIEKNEKHVVSNGTDCNQADTISRRVTDEITQFTKSWLGFIPKSIHTDIHNQAFTVTMTGILSEAEKNASKNKDIAELIVKNHVEAFKSVRWMIEKQVAQIANKSVARSSLLLDPESNCATILFQLD